MLQRVIDAAAALPVGLLVERAPMGSIGGAVPELIILGVFSTAAAFGLQTMAQRHMAAAHAALIVSSESVFGAAGGYLILSEKTGAMGIAGAVLIIAGIVLISVWSGPPVGALKRVE